jgi:hypothetical protein
VGEKAAGTQYVLGGLANVLWARMYATRRQQRRLSSERYAEQLYQQRPLFSRESAGDLTVTGVVFPAHSYNQV